MKAAGFDWGFIAEFVRVQSDKLILFGLLLYMLKIHAPDLWIGNVQGALLVLIQGQRFRYPGGGGSSGIGPIDPKW